MQELNSSRKKIPVPIKIDMTKKENEPKKIKRWLLNFWEIFYTLILANLNFLIFFFISTWILIFLNVFIMNWVKNLIKNESIEIISFKHFYLSKEKIVICLHFHHFSHNSHSNLDDKFNNSIANDILSWALLLLCRIIR